jgi:hypothetical protein
MRLQLPARKEDDVRSIIRIWRIWEAALEYCGLANREVEAGVRLRQDCAHSRRQAQWLHLQ